LLFLEILLALAAVLPEEDEKVLARAIKAGDRTAFRRFFEAHHASLLRYLVHRKVDAETAEDLVQNAFIHVWEKRGEIRADGSLRGLLYRIAYTRALNHFRDTARFVDAEPGFLEQASATPDPAESQEVRVRLAAAVASLPERRRAVFELCMLEGFSYREAAETLEISIKTVENQMGHALKTVRQLLEPLIK
jgi:RNA polymerase sigma-19 factor, ECF subfamily